MDTAAPTAAPWAAAVSVEVVSGGRKEGKKELPAPLAEEEDARAEEEPGAVIVIRWCVTRMGNCCCWNLGYQGRIGDNDFCIC